MTYPAAPTNPAKPVHGLSREVNRSTMMGLTERGSIAALASGRTVAISRTARLRIEGWG